MNAAERGLLAHLCAAFNDDRLERRQFADAVWAVVSVWDCITVSIYCAQAEATVKRHFCEWWSDCDNECVYRRNRDQRPPWQDGWGVLDWQPSHATTAKASEKCPTLRARDARSVVTGTLRAKIFARDGHKCVMCGAKPPLEVDHVVPVSLGGSGNAENLQSLCGSCNRKKGVSLHSINTAAALTVVERKPA